MNTTRDAATNLWPEIAPELSVLLSQQATHQPSNLLRQSELTIFAGVPRPVVGKPFDQCFASVGANAAVDVRDSVARLAKAVSLNGHHMRQRPNDATMHSVAGEAVAAVVADDIEPGYRLAVLQFDGHLAMERRILSERGKPRRNFSDTNRRFLVARHCRPLVCC